MKDFFLLVFTIGVAWVMGMVLLLATISVVQAVVL